MTSPETNAMTLEPDDPRISEWIDGRLPAAEAAAIERAVQATPSLAALVADLRAIKAASPSVAAAAPPAGFADRVMAAVTAAALAGATPGDEAVDEEWQAVEAERIAAERAEAAADLAQAAREHRPRPWPWMALAGALAAGVVMTVVLNLPTDGRREVALTPPAEADRGVPPNAAPEADSMATTDKDAADVALNDDEPRLVARSLSAANPAAAAPAALPTEAATSPGIEGSIGVAASLASPESAGEAVESQLEEAVVTVTVSGPVGRAAFEQRAATLGLVVSAAGEGRGGARDDRAVEGPSARRNRARLAEEAEVLPEEVEVMEISGPESAIERLLAETRKDFPAAAFDRESLRQSANRMSVESLERGPPRAAGAGGAAEKQDAARRVESAGRQATNVARVLVRLIEVPEPARPAATGPGATKP